MNFITVQRVRGVEMIEYHPSMKMLLFVHARAHPKTKHLSDDDVCEGVGLSRDQIRRWRKAYNPYFDEWLTEWLENYTNSNVREALEMVGLKKALEGDFQFWKPFALREKIIQPDQQTLSVIPVSLDNYDNLSDDDIKSLQSTLLLAARGVDESGGIGVAEPLDKEGPESSPHGATEVPAEPVVLPKGVGPDGERALEDEITL
jgi:hypothetical protein